MIAGIILFGVFLGAGYLVARRVLADQEQLIILWAGLVLGCVGSLWAVVPFAFGFGFTKVSHLGALALSVGLTGVVYLGVRPRREKKVRTRLKMTPIGVAIVLISAITFALMGQKVLYPHNGGLLAGHGTYGDLPLHAAMISNLAEQKIFPPDYPIFAGVRMGYPFLVNVPSATLVLFGWPLRAAILIPSFFLVLTVVGGYTLLAKEILKKAWLSALAACLFFFNGGFAFIYYIGNLQGYYTSSYYTPNNDPGHNIVWWNIISHILIPQRASLAGWAVLFFALWLLIKGIHNLESRFFILAGILVGCLPMIHTVSFFAMLLIGLIWSVVYFPFAGDKRAYLKNWGLFIFCLTLLAVPQLGIWIIPQALLRAVPVFRVQFNLGNVSDPWVWFWLKNVGIVFLLMFPAITKAGKRTLLFYSPAIALFVLGECFVFQTHPVDNNKIFFIWYALTVILVVQYVHRILEGIKTRQRRVLLTCGFLCLGTLSAILTITKDAQITHTLFSAQEVKAADFVKQQTLSDGLFITGSQHANFISALAGRRVLAGSYTHLYSHGFDTKERFGDVKLMYTHVEQAAELFEFYGVDYMLVSMAERQVFDIDVRTLSQRYPVVYDKDNIQIYAVSQRAQQELLKRDFN